MTVEEFLKTFTESGKTQQAKDLAAEILQSGWYPEAVVYLNKPYNPSKALFGREARIEWCKENCSKNWKEYSWFFWLFECEKEALHFRMVWT